MIFAAFSAVKTPFLLVAGLNAYRAYKFLFKQMNSDWLLPISLMHRVLPA